jgi:hypothetical protein
MRANPDGQHSVSLPKIFLLGEDSMNQKSASFWIKAIISFVIGLACYLAMQQSAQASSLQPAPVFASPVGPGNLMVYRVGDGSAALGSAATAVFVDEYTTGGTLIQSIAIPTTTVGLQRRLTASGSADSEGLLTLSDDRQFIMLTGYDAAPGTAGVVGATASTVNRVVGRIDILGNVDTSTALTDFASGSNPRSAASTNGTNIWVAGGTSGVRYTTFGSTTSTPVATTPATVRVVKIGRGQLYVSSSSGAYVGLNTVGSGLPTTSGQSVTLLPGLPGTGSPYSYYLADLDAGVSGYDTLYLTEDGGNGGTQGIRKYSLVGTTWITNGATIPLTGVRGLTGIHSGNTVTLYATYGTSSNTLGRVVDTSGYNSAPAATTTSLATAPLNTAFRGVAFSPGTSPTAVQVINLSVHPTDSTPLLLLIAFGLVGVVGVWLFLRRRSRTA